MSGEHPPPRRRLFVPTRARDDFLATLKRDGTALAEKRWRDGSPLRKGNLVRVYLGDDMRWFDGRVVKVRRKRIVIVPTDAASERCVHAILSQTRLAPEPQVA